MIAKEKQLVHRLLENMRPVVDAARVIGMSDNAWVSIGGIKQVQVHHLRSMIVAFDTMADLAKTKHRLNRF